MNARTIDPRDLIVQEHAPTIMVPSHSPLAPLEAYGHRYLAARDGLWIDIHRPLARIRAPLAASPLPLPYGSPEPVFEFAFGRIGEHMGLLKQFIAEARAALPNEFAAWLVWDSYDKVMLYRPCRTIDASADRIHFERPNLDRNECLAIDLHSHGAAPAFFSSTDNADDAGEVKIAGVVGSLDQPAPSLCFRVCAMGVFVDVQVPAEALKP